MPITYKGYATYGDIEIRLDVKEFRLVIGHYCSIGKNSVVHAMTHHQSDRVSTYPFLNMFGWGTNNEWCKGHVTINHDVWIADNVTIMSGVTIGTGAILATGAIVTKDVPPYAIVGGSPATIKKYRFDSETIDLLLQSQWWLLRGESLKPYAHMLSSNDVEVIRDFARTVAPMPKDF